MLESVENRVLQNDFYSLANSSVPFDKLDGKFYTFKKNDLEKIRKEFD